MVSVAHNVPKWEHLPVRDWRTTSLAERIEHVRTLVLGDVKQAELARRSGLAPALISRYLRPKGRKGGATPEQLAKMADGWGVSYEWLVLGRGQPLDARLGNAAHPNLEIAIAYHSGRFSDRAIQQLRARSLKSAVDPAPESWAAALRRLDEQLQIVEIDPSLAETELEIREDPVSPKANTVAAKRPSKATASSTLPRK